MSLIEVKLDHTTGCPKVPSKAFYDDAGWDLYTSREVVLFPQETVDVHTDISIKIPRGLYGRVTGRSSTIRKHKLMVSEGIIDNGYTGELFIGVTNIGDKAFTIKQGVRIAQLLIGAVLPVDFVEVDYKLEGSRGNRGFGSTGE